MQAGIPSAEKIGIELICEISRVSVCLSEGIEEAMCTRLQFRGERKYRRTCGKVDRFAGSCILRFNATEEIPCMRDDGSGGDTQAETRRTSTVMLSGPPRSSAMAYKLLAGLRRRIGLYDAGQVRRRRPRPRARQYKEEAMSPSSSGTGMFRNVRSDIPAGTEGRGKNVALRVRLGIFGAHDAALHQTANIRMIAS